MKSLLPASSLLLACALALSVTLTASAQRSDAALHKQIDLFVDLFRTLDMFYVDTLAADTAVRWAIDGMLEHVDPFTVYYPGDDDDELTQMTTGKYAGIGSVIRYHKDHRRAQISEPYAGTPSEKAGLKAGDVILSIDAKDVRDVPVSEVTKRLRGESGTTFSLRVMRPQIIAPDVPVVYDTLSFSITRRNIQMPVVPYAGIISDSIGYLALTGFTEGSAVEVRRTIKTLLEKGLTSLVLDLRGNPGGSLEEAVDILSLFLPKGTLVVSTKGKLPNTCREMRTRTQPIVPSCLPVAVLVNSGSASAAEIVSGSLQDLDRAIIVGQRTYGKGLVQSIKETPGGGSLKITTSRYYIPSGRCIQAYDYRHLNPDGSVGIVPDSLTHVFRTASGREVRDGGGITPDVAVTPDSLPTMIYDLVGSDQLFDFVTEYVALHPTIAPPGEFVLSDDDYNSFVRYVTTHDFRYNRRSNEALRRLRDIARVEGYLDAARPALDSLEKAFNPEISADLIRFRPEISRYLADEIVTRYYGNPGSVRRMLQDDKDFAAALAALHARDTLKQ